MQQNSLRRFLDRAERLFILTGAGCSTESGIPDYRDADGAWRALTYAETLARMRTIAQALLDRKLSAERPLAIGDRIRKTRRM